MQKTVINLSFLALTLLSADAAVAQFAKPEDAIKYRQSSLFVMQQNFAHIAAMAKGKEPFDAKAAARYAEVATFVSKLPWAGFTADSKGGKASDDIWTESAKFNAGIKEMLTEMEALNSAAKSGSLDAIKAAVGKVGASCKSCHDDFRTK